jgi:serine/threonine protein kinase
LSEERTAEHTGAEPESPLVSNLTVARRYHLLRRLGVGGMGEVWSAHDQLTGQTVAVKLLLPSIAGAPAAEIRFQREIEAMARIHHPRIVPLIDAGRDPVVGLFFVMLLHPGRQLHEVSRQWKSWEEIYPVVDQVLETLAFAHARGVIHRDIKPENILIDQAGEPVLLDFGVARLKDRARSGTSAHDMLGTVDYAAPEQATGHRRRIGPWTDLYAFGIVLYEIICGRLPFWAASAVQSLMIRLDHGCPPLEPRGGVSTPFGLWDVLNKMLSPTIDDRFQHVADARAALHRLSRAPLEVLNPGADSGSYERGDERHNTTMTEDEAGKLLSRRSSRFVIADDFQVEARPLEPPLRPANLMGRDDLMLSFSRGLSAWVRVPRPGVLVVAGAPGTGKSRLAEELVVPAAAMGEIDMHRYFWPSLGMSGGDLRDLALSLAGSVGMTVEATRDHIEWWLGARGLTGGPTRDQLLDWLASGEPARDASVSFEENVGLMVEFLARVGTRERPFVLWVDGLDRLDATLVALAEGVRARGLPIILLVTTRDATAPPGLELPRWLTSATRVLEPLTEDAMRAIVDELVDVPIDEREGLVYEADGNTQNLVDAVQERRRLGRLVPAWPRWRIPPESWQKDTQRFYTRRVD